MYEIERSGGAFLLACSLALPLFGADPFTGTWKLHPAKSKLLPPAPRSDTVRIQIDGKDIRIEQEGTDGQGAPFKLTVVGGLDDRSYGIGGSSYAESVSFRRSSNRHILAEFKKAGVAVAWVDAEVSGSSLKVNLTLVYADGKEIKSLAILQKE